MKIYMENNNFQQRFGEVNIFCADIFRKQDIPNDFYAAVINPNELKLYMISYKCLDFSVSGNDCIAITFTESLARQISSFWNNSLLMHNADSIAEISLTQEEADRLVNQAENIISGNYSVEHSNYLIKKIISYIFSEYTSVSEKKPAFEHGTPIWLEKTVEIMKESENFTKGISRMIEISDKTPEHLSRSMKKYYGISPTEFINSLRMKNASYLLINTDKTIVDICYENGYQNISWFNTLFKKTFGQNPSEYRKSNR